MPGLYQRFYLSKSIQGLLYREPSLINLTLLHRMTIYLPKEVWVQIWSFLDFETLHKICRTVCKTWFVDIRESGRLSGRLKIRNCELQDNELKKILSNWEKLKVLELCKATEIDLSVTHKFLNKVINPFDGEDEEIMNNSLNNNAILEKTVNKIWFDPSKSTPMSCQDSIIDITLKSDLENDVYNNVSSPGLTIFMKNLESVHIILMTEENGVDERVYAPLFESLESCPNLEKLLLEVTHTPNFSILGTLIAAYLRHLKSLEIFDAFHDGLNGSAMTEVFFGRLNWLPVMPNLEYLKFSDLTLSMLLLISRSFTNIL